MAHEELVNKNVNNRLKTLVQTRQTRSSNQLMLTNSRDAFSDSRSPNMVPFDMLDIVSSVL